MSQKTSLRQYLMRAGCFEKVYDCIASIKIGDVTVNEKLITNPNHFFNPKSALVKLKDKKIKTVKKLYFLMNKPAGFLSQKDGNEKTIYDLLEKLKLSKESLQSLFAVGRLDKDTEGLIIITNDGKISDMISNPANNVSKKYFAALEKPADREKIRLLEKGIELEVGRIKHETKPCKIKVVGKTEIYISISEGKKRQIRLMFEAVGNKVNYLKRVSIGGLQLGSLKEGELRQLTKEEIMEKLEI